MRTDQAGDLDAVSCASLPAGSLAALADLRRVPGVSACVSGGRDWVRWEPSAEAAVVRRVLPVEGSVLYARRGGHWYRPGRHLPAFGVPPGDGEFLPLYRAVTPLPVRPLPADGPPPGPVALRLVRDDRARPATALRCTLDELSRWAESAASVRLGAVRGAVAGGEALLLGRVLPPVAVAARFWGDLVLSPLGLRPEPDLPEPALRGALGAGAGELLVLSDAGAEPVPLAAFRPLTRAGVRLGAPGAAVVLTVDDYLAIPDAYGRWLGGLRWCASGEAVEHAADDPAVGLTFALGAEIAPFLEGLAADGGFLHFAHVLHLLDLLGYGHRLVSVRAASGRRRDAPDLARAFYVMGRPLRNAGALCAALCRGVPRVPDPPRLDRVLTQLTEKSPIRFAILRTYPGDEPPTGPGPFESRVVEALEALSAADLEHWFRHGRGPAVGAGEGVARVVPNSLGDLLSELEGRPRLRAAAALVARLSGAIALPPRRLAHAELPLGGYVDVASRGLPEQILPGQFALDPDEFLRRFAEHELLYYHREEPHATAAREVLLLVDQGVRTWGDVRVVLASAALALGRQAERRGLALRVATTGTGGEPLDLPAAGAEVVGSALEASDLSASPAEALARVLGAPGAGDAPRDVVLLTHPRSLAEPGVASASLRAAAGTRVFAVAVDAGGAVALSEVRRGAPVEIGRCRVDLGAAPAPAWSQYAAGGAGGSRPWRGDVEAVGFPFLVGATDPIDDRLIAFDGDGGWLVLADRGGLLRGWRVDGTAAEMFPRAVVSGHLLDEVDVVLGVAGGFVVAGRAGSQWVAAHHDLVNRACTAHVLGPRRGTPVPTWSYDRASHSVVAFVDLVPLVAVDLAAGHDRAVFPTQPGASERAASVFAGVREVAPEAVVVRVDRPVPARGRAILFAEWGRVAVREDLGDWRPFTPLSDGTPMIHGDRVVRARWHGETLAAVADGPDGKRVLHVFSVTGNSGRPIGEFPLDRGVKDFAMSGDGRRLAWRVNSRRVVVRETSDALGPKLLTPRGRAQPLQVWFHPDFLAVQAGRHAHLIAWDGPSLRLHDRAGDVHPLIAGEVARNPSRAAARKVVGRGTGPYHRARFLASLTYADAVVGFDRLGQVAVFDRGGVVCMFYVVRERLSAWMPDGTRLGPDEFTGGPPTPGAAGRIASALKAVFSEGEGLVP